jgi:hypothetical protein
VHPLQDAKNSDAYVELSAGKQELLKRRMNLAARCVMQVRCPGPAA